MPIDTLRHDSVIDTNQINPPITIVGAGATGSRIFASLVELGFTNITVIDYDVVESHNLANQMFLHHHIGMPKVTALGDWYTLKTGEPLPDSIKLIEAAVPCDEAPLEGFVFLLTDTMASRAEIFKEALHENYDVEHVIETRMASSYGNILSFDPCQEEEAASWWNTLISDDDAEQSACGSSISVGATASLIANTAVWQLINLLTEPSCADPRINLFFKPFTGAANEMVPSADSLELLLKIDTATEEVSTPLPAPLPPTPPPAPLSPMPTPTPEARAADVAREILGNT